MGKNKRWKRLAKRIKGTCIREHKPNCIMFGVCKYWDECFYATDDIAEYTPLREMEKAIKFHNVASSFCIQHEKYLK